MKITKSQLKELIKQAIVEESDIMDKDMENPKTGNTIKVRTALQLPDDHPANKKAKEMVSKSSPTKDDEPTAATPAPKGKSKGPTKNPFSKESPAYDTFDSEKPDDEPSDDSGGPSYADVPKGAKSTKQANLMKKNDSAAKDLGYKNTEDLAMDGTADELGELLDSIPDEGQNFNEADEMINYIRDNEMGERDDDDDVVDGYRKAFLSMVNAPGKGGSGKSGKDIEKDSMKAADDANTKMDKAELKKAYDGADKLKDKLDKAYEAGDRDAMKKIGQEIDAYWRDVVNPLEKKVYGESIEEFKQKRFTVKEVHKWMKTLEENRYKKVYNADARRVSWMCNNIGENVVNMPKSMRKKWSKAQYGRERYLAKEFLKSKKEQMNENKIRLAIRNILSENKRRELEIHVRDKIKVDKILKKLKLKPGKDYDIGFGSSRSFMLDINVKYLDKVVATFMQNRINVK